MEIDTAVNIIPPIEDVSIIRAPSNFDDTAHSSINAFVSTFFPSIQNIEARLLQPSTESYLEPHQLALLTQHVLSFVAAGPNTMTLKEAMSQPDSQQFLEAMRKELDYHITGGNWKVIPEKYVQPHKQSIPMVWSMKRKRGPIGEIIKWKSRLCAVEHRSMDLFDYWETYSLVVSWQIIHLILILATVNN